MMILAAIAALTTADCGPYLRSRIDDDNPRSQCLYWRDKSQVEFLINDQGNPENMGAEITATQNALATWQAQFDVCGSLTLSFGPRTAKRLAGYLDNSADNQNLVLWRFKRCTEVVADTDPCWAEETCGNKFDCWEHKKPGALAITTTSFDPSTGQILDADVELNWPNFLFTTVDSPVCVAPNFALSCVATDVQNTMTHEFGHALGLGHSCHATSTMFFNAGTGELSKRELDIGSKLFVCQTYPRDQPAQTCSGTPATPVQKQCGCSSGAGLLGGGLGLLALFRRRRCATPSMK